MSFSISPEILSPANPPATPTPLPLPQSSPPAPMEQIVSPFPSPLPPEKTADSSPPAVPPAKSPATDNPPPPVDLVSPPPPDATLSPPSPAPEIPPSTESSPPPPPAAPLPVPSPPSPILTSPVPPEAVSPSPPPPPPPLPESPPPPEPSPDEKATPPAPQAPKNKNSPPPKRASVITAPPPKSPPSPSPPLSPEENPEASPLQPPPPRSLPNSNKTTASPTLASPPASAGRSLPAAVQIRKAEPNLRLSPGFIAGCAVVSLVVIAVFACVVSCVVCYKRHRRRTKGIGLPQHYHPKAPSLGRKEKFSISTLPTLHPPPIKSSSVAITASTDSGPGPAGHGTLSYGQLAAATGGFSEVNLVGEGGFGCVFKGVLPGGREVAVKQLRTGSRQGEREFRAEVEIISRIHHKHLVSLVGYCINGNERLLVYEFVPNNTLDFHLYGKQEHVMEWETRLKIAIGSAKGLAYLHEDCNPKVIHRDIKASNILLDFSFEAKVSDFGLAKSFSDTNANISHISTRVVGTFGYLAPEYASSGKVTEKSDVYSYGVVLLELITGKPPISSMNQGLVEWARPLLAQAMEDGNFDSLVDPQLQRNYNPDEMSRMVTCAAACVRHSAWLRPRMSQIVHALEGHASLTNFHEGLTPGSSTLYGSPSSSYNAQQYTNDLNKFHRAVVDQEHGNESTCSGSTSEYGLNPSVSSGEMPSRRFRN